MRHIRLFFFPDFSVRPKKIPSRKSKMDMPLNVQNQILMGSLKGGIYTSLNINHTNNRFTHHKTTGSFRWFCLLYFQGLTSNGYVVPTYLVFAPIHSFCFFLQHKSLFCLPPNTTLHFFIFYIIVRIESYKHNGSMSQIL